MSTLAGWCAGRELVVLAWHNIDPTWRFPARPGAGRAGFHRQLRALRRATTVVPLEPSLRALRAGAPLPPRPVALTFDDGYRDNLAVATPLLRELGLPATVFLLPDVLDRRGDPWWERLAWALTRATVPRVEFGGAGYGVGGSERGATLARLERELKERTAADRDAAVAELVDALEPAGRYRPEELFMDWDEAVSMARAGVGIGSHTSNHAILAREPEPAQLADLRGSRERLVAGLEMPIDILAYPNGQPGDHDAATERAAAAAGYSCGLTAHGLVNDAETPPYAVRRRVLEPGDSAARVVLGLFRGVRCAPP